MQLGSSAATGRPARGFAPQVLVRVCVGGGGAGSGADPVAFFSLSPGEPFVPGSPDYSSTLNGYTFYFSSAENQAKFEADPWAFAPSYGAFCSWGMSEERMPDYNWEPSNLGPNADLNLWLVRNGRLFFFYKSEAMEKFLVDPDQFMLDGDERWAEWFGDKETSPFNTACYVQMDEDDSSSTTSSSKRLSKAHAV